MGPLIHPTDSSFQKIKELAQFNNMLDIYCCHGLYSLADQMKTVEGELVVMDVWRRGMAEILAGAAPRKSVHLFDIFSRVAKADENAFFQATGNKNLHEP